MLRKKSSKNHNDVSTFVHQSVLEYNMMNYYLLTIKAQINNISSIYRRTEFRTPEQASLANILIPREALFTLHIVVMSRVNMLAIITSLSVLIMGWANTVHLRHWNNCHTTKNEANYYVHTSCRLMFVSVWQETADQNSERGTLTEYS